MKPVIGITTFYDRKPDKTYDAVSNSYVTSVIRAGGLPILLPVVEEVEMADEYLNAIDGLLLSGGEDVCTMRYGENPIKEVELFCPQRDDFEINLFIEALQRDMPVLGICRGLQVMNAALGGSLYQDIFTQVADVLGHLPRKMPVDTLFHCIRFTPGSRLEAIFQTRDLRVNSYHHQAVKQVADAFEATAFSTDNIIEAIEHREKSFAMGVQWHPEDLTLKYPHFIKLFEALVDAAAAGKTQACT